MKSKTAWTSLLALGLVLGAAADRWMAPPRHEPRGQPEPAASAGLNSKTNTPSPVAPALVNLEAQLGAVLAELTPWRRQRALFQLGNSIPLAEIASKLPVLVGKPQPEALTLACHLLVRWAQGDPAAALRYAQSVPRSPRRQKLMTTALSEWAAASPVAALAWVSNLPDSRDKEQLVSSALDIVARADAKQALTLLDSMGGNPNRAMARAAILRRWAERDPAAAAAAAARATDLPGGVYSDIASQWASADPKTAVAWAQGLASVPLRNQALIAAVRAWAETDLPGAAAFSVAQPPTQTQLDMLGIIGGQWASKDPVSAMNWATNLPPGGVRDRAMRQAACLAAVQPNDQQAGVGIIAAGMAEADTDGTITWIKALPGQLRGTAARVAVQGLAGQDPETAGRLVAGLDPDIRGQCMVTLAMTWARQDLPGALDWLKQLPDGADKSLGLSMCVKEWCANDAPAAAAWSLAAYSAKGEDDGLLGNVAFMWGSVDPKAAADWVQKLAPGPVRTLALNTLIGGWVQNSPVEAATYAAGLPPDEGAGVVQQAVQAWASFDPAAAGGWVTSFPSGSYREAMVSDVANYWVDKDPPSAAAWVQSADSKQGMLEVARIWLLRDPEAALSWIQSWSPGVGLSSADVQWLLSGPTARSADSVKQRLLGLLPSGPIANPSQ